MSDREHAIHPADLDEFIRETQADTRLFIMGDEDGAAGLCPYLTFYLRHTTEQRHLVARRMVDLCNAFIALADTDFRLIRGGGQSHWHPCRDHGELRGHLSAIAREIADTAQGLSFEATDKAIGGDSPRWSIALKLDSSATRFSYLKFTFRMHWYQYNRDTWHRFVSQAVGQLQPEQCYSGFEIGNGGFAMPLPRWHRMLERACAARLLGLDIDHPPRMSEHSQRQNDGSIRPVGLGSGLRPPTWCFLLSPRWLAHLGRTPQEVTAAFVHPSVTIDAIPYTSGGSTPGQLALWIRLGELDAYPVEGPPPTLPRMATRLLRPVLLNGPELFDGQAGGSLDTVEAIHWLHRFDTDTKG